MLQPASRPDKLKACPTKPHRAERYAFLVAILAKRQSPRPTLAHSVRIEVAMASRNRILSRMDKDTFRALVPDLTATHLEAGATLWRPESNVRKIYFPVTAVISLLASTDGSRELELLTVGNEGLLGLQALADIPRALGRAVVQVPGDALVTSSRGLRELMRRDAGLANLIARYTYLTVQIVVQTAMCHRFHSVQERCARWLLTTHDRAGTDAFSLSQAFLGKMMGAARSKVNIALAHLRRSGAVDQQYRRIVVVDRQALESLACPCYDTLQRVQETLEI